MCCNRKLKTDSERRNTSSTIRENKTNPASRNLNPDNNQTIIIRRRQK